MRLGPCSAWLASTLVIAAVVKTPVAHACEPCQAPRVINCGHRGTGSSSDAEAFPENTIPSIVEAAREGATMVELDVLHSGDGTLVVLHDDDVGRTTDGTGCAGDLSVSELQAFDAAVGTSLEGTGVVIPTLAEAVAASEVDINIEIKVSDGGGCPASDRDALAADVVAFVQATPGRRYVVSSFDAEVLSRIEAIDPAVETGLLTIAGEDAMLAEARGFDALHLLAIGIDADVVADVHDRGLLLHAWTENGPGRMDTLIDLGVDMIITDAPEVLAGVIADRCAAPPPCPEEGGCSVRPPAEGDRSALALLVAAVALGVRRRRQSS